MTEELDIEDGEEIEDDWWCDFCDVNRPNAWQLTPQGNYLICYFCQEKQHAELREEGKRAMAEYTFVQTNLRAQPYKEVTHELIDLPPGIGA